MTRTPQAWKKLDTTLTRTVMCHDFTEAVERVNNIAKLAEKLKHHPDITIKNYKELHIFITTHSKGTLTQKDYDLAEAINDMLGMTATA